MWSYAQGTGVLAHDGAFVCDGYSGHGSGRNNSAAQAEAETGPIPQGRYRIGAAYDHPHLGPCVMNLVPAPETNCFGRSLFRIHGDSRTHDASRGCIVLGPEIRARIASSGDRDLTVTR